MTIVRPLLADGNLSIIDIKIKRRGGLSPEWEQVWKVYQDHDNSIYPDIAPGQAAWLTFNVPYHGNGGQGDSGVRSGYSRPDPGEDGAIILTYLG